MGRISTFAERLSKLLEIKNITKAELSRRTGISKSSITHYIKGDWEGKQNAVYAIATEFNVNEAWLMGYEVPMQRNGFSSATEYVDVYNQDSGWFPPLCFWDKINNDRKYTM